MDLPVQPAQITADVTKAKNLNPRRRHRTYPAS
jgi:hypothetical protein